MAVPGGVPFDDVDVDAASEEYLQCAGSAGALTVELRAKASGDHEHWVLATAPITGEPNHTISWDEDFSTEVHAEEVFTAHEAAPLFEEYYRTGTVPDSVPRRKV
ncbi:NTP pyrophosphohydrolase [Tessaracoccus antarcticus]|uniref:NTP pyrophosphohydrolase n=1 Tax=Tessaracoccus antarcticus TaxID=2479848 RepID=A0A3M0GBH7_9ACTN|nr:NTP pyrophosphohydrolase [Tessaracoccus antarcticus]RMB61728.1 NTP pyrophosphohydrolase [Tessaracoccus antarcticus]